VVDWNNTSGFGIGGKPPLVAIYTGAHGVQDQRIAYSNDHGRTWTKYAGNPVIDIGSNAFRDPKVSWNAATSRWVMVVALSDQRKVRFYSSPDLKPGPCRANSAQPAPPRLMGMPGPFPAENCRRKHDQMGAQRERRRRGSPRRLGRPVLRR